MRISTFELFQRGLEGILNQQRALSDLQLQISSGKRILKPSDDPVGATRAINIREVQSSLEQYSKNGQSGQANLEAEDATLKATNQIYQRVRELALQAANPVLSQTDRQAVAIEIQVQLDQLLGLSNSKDADGAFMFSGSAGRTPAVTQNASGQFIYQGDEGQKFAKIGSSLSIETSDSGKDLFFLVPSGQVNTFNSLGVASTSAASTGLVASGSLSLLSSNDLIINDVDIQAGFSDGVSSIDSASSALAMANAINASQLDHGVRAHAEPNVFNLGVYTSAAITSGDFTLNGVTIIDAGGSESSLLSQFQSLEAQTGVIVTQPGGPGTDMILTAQDGRNIQLQTDGASPANFSNFNLNAGATDNVQRAGLTLRGHQNFMIGGAMPSNVGLSAGGYSVTNNTGTGLISQPVITSPLADLNETYSVIFGAGGTTFNIVADSAPLVPLEGFENVSFTPGAMIELNGIQIQISGAPSSGDVFGVQFDKPANQDVFKTISNLVSSITGTVNSDQRSYEIGIALDNLSHAETKTLEIRASVGARLNVIENQKDVNATMSILTEQSLSDTEDLDLAKAISELAQRTTALEAAQATYIKIQSLSLFNYIR